MNSCTDGMLIQLHSVKCTCGHPEQSIRHVVLECTVARQFWNQTRVATGLKLPQLNPATWASDLLLPICSERDRALNYTVWSVGTLAPAK